MQLRYHHDRDSDGVLILELEPSLRTLFLNYSMKKIALPYTYFIMRYVKTKENKLKYPGIYGNGLHVYGSLEPIDSFESEVFCLPFENNFGGLVCTPHMHDGKIYPNIKSYVQEVSQIFFGSRHIWNYGVNLNDISSIKTLKNVKWECKRKLINHLNRKKSFGCPTILNIQQKDFISVKYDGNIEIKKYVNNTIKCDCGNCVCNKRHIY